MRTLLLLFIAFSGFSQAEETADEAIQRKIAEAKVLDGIKKVATGSLSSQREQMNEIVSASPKPLTDEEAAKLADEHYSEWLDGRRAVIAEIRRIRSIEGRVRDPFGFSPKAGIGPKSSSSGASTTAAGQMAAGPVQEVTAGMAVDTLQIVGVSESRQEFFVGARTIRQGDTLTLSYAGRTFVLKVARVTAGEIIFEEADGKKAVKPLAIVPPDTHPMMQPLAR